MKCQKCGYPLPEDSIFCHYCGTHLEPLMSSDIPSEKPVSSEEPVLPTKSAVSDSEPTPKTVANEKSETTTNPVTPAVTCVNAASPIVASVVERPPHQNNNTQQTYCKKCGSVVDPITKKCSGCEKQYFRAKTTIPLIAIAVLLVVSIGLNVMQYIQHNKSTETVAYQSSKIEELEATITTQKRTISSLKDTMASLSGKAEYYDTICGYLASGNIGYVSETFRASEGIILVDKDEKNRKFVLTANWYSGGTVSVDYSSYAATVRFDNDAWWTSTEMTIVPHMEGITAVTFSNSLDSTTFKVLIIVTD